MTDTAQQERAENLDDALEFFEKSLIDFYEQVESVSKSWNSLNGQKPSVQVREKGDKNINPEKGKIDMIMKEYKQFSKFVKVGGSFSSRELATLFITYTNGLPPCSMWSCMQTDWMEDSDIKIPDIGVTLRLGAFYRRACDVDRNACRNSNIITVSNTHCKSNFIKSFYKILKFATDLKLLYGRRVNGEDIPYDMDNPDSECSAWLSKSTRYEDIIEQLTNAIEGQSKTSDYIMAIVDKFAIPGPDGTKMKARDIKKFLDNGMSAEGFSKIINLVPELLNGNLSQDEIIKKLKSTPMIADLLKTQGLEFDDILKFVSNNPVASVPADTSEPKLNTRDILRDQLSEPVRKNNKGKKNNSTKN